MPVQVTSDQELAVPAAAQADVVVGEGGQLSGSATAYGNSFTTDAGDADVSAGYRQTVRSGGWITSRALIEAASYAESTTASAASGANTATTISRGGYADMAATQANGAEVTSEATIAADNADVLVSTALTNTVVNNAALESAGDANFQANQTNDGKALASSNTTVGGSYAVTSAATMVGNNADLYAQGGVGTMAVTQTNTGDMKAENVVAVGTMAGQATSNSMAAGNSASAAVSGPALDAYFDQTNTASIGSDARMSWDNGQTGVASASAYGNTASATLCSDCGGDMYAANRQVNSGRVGARASNYVNSAGALSSNSLAVGNSATFQTGSPY